MNQPHPSLVKKVRLVSLVLYVVGTLLGLALAGTSAWADFEAQFYGFNSITRKTLSTLKCPIFLTPRDSGLITASFTNSLERDVTPTIRFDLSGPYLIHSERTRPTIAAGETKKFTWKVTSDNIDLRYFITLKVTFYPVSILPAREASCGMIWLDLPFIHGDQIAIGMLVLSLLGMGAGVSLWLVYNRPLQGRLLDLTRAMVFLELLVLGSMLSGLAGWWALGGILLVLVVLMSVVMSYFLIVQD